jgi:hypothetical protein
MAYALQNQEGTMKLLEDKTVFTYAHGPGIML